MAIFPLKNMTSEFVTLRCYDRNKRRKPLFLLLVFLLVARDLDASICIHNFR